MQLESIGYNEIGAARLTYRFNDSVNIMSALRFFVKASHWMRINRPEWTFVVESSSSEHSRTITHSNTDQEKTIMDWFISSIKMPCTKIKMNISDAEHIEFDTAYTVDDFSGLCIDVDMFRSISDNGNLLTSILNEIESDPFDYKTLLDHETATRYMFVLNARMETLEKESQRKLVESICSKWTRQSRSSMSAAVIS